MKKSGKCPKCEGVRIVHLSAVHDADGPRTETTRHLARMPMSFLFLSTTHKCGAVEAYVCTSCGFFEEHVVNPGAVPWDKVEGARWYSPE